MLETIPCFVRGLGFLSKKPPTPLPLQSSLPSLPLVRAPQSDRLIFPPNLPNQIQVVPQSHHEALSPTGYPRRELRHSISGAKRSAIQVDLPRIRWVSLFFSVKSDPSDENKILFQSLRFLVLYFYRRFSPIFSTCHFSLLRYQPKPQSRFKEDLVARDSACLITEAHCQQCVAAHIVPQSRKDVSEVWVSLYRLVDVSSPLITFLVSKNAQIYQELLGLLVDVFATSAGLLLRTDMHKRYDNYELSLYFKASPLGRVVPRYYKNEY